MASFGLRLDGEKTRGTGVWTVCGRTPRAPGTTSPGDVRLPWVHAHLRSNPRDPALHRPADDLGNPDARDVEGAPPRPDATTSRPGAQDRGMAEPRGPGIPELPRSSGQPETAGDVP